MSRTLQTQLGVHLLETITLGMYSDPRHCVREYIQNAFDSIRTARRQGLLGPDDGHIDVIVDQHTSTLRIRDNGTGLDPEEAVVNLVDIGYSRKASTSDGASINAGFRGIGRMAGMSYCRRLTFETTNGTGRGCNVAFDAHAINRLTRPGQEPTTIVDAIRRNCTSDEQEFRSTERFLQVSLEQIDNPALLDVEKLASYLEQTAPVRQDPTKWRFQGKIRSFAQRAEHPESLDAVSVRICDSEGRVIREIYRPFKDLFEIKDRQRESPRRVNVTDVMALPRQGEYHGWWGWLAEHPRHGKLSDDIPFRGLRVRMHNIAIGDHSLLQPFWPSRHLALWCFGEIYVADSTLVPNAQRDNFEPSEALSRIHEQVREELRQIEKDIRRESRERSNSVRVIRKNADRVTKRARRRLDDGLTSKNEKTQLIDELDKVSARIKDAIPQRNRTDEERSNLRWTLREVDHLKEEVENVRRTDADASMSHLNRQARRAVRTVLSIVKQELDDDKRFAAIEKRVIAELRPGNRDH